jgi:hypothetical protein
VGSFSALDGTLWIREAFQYEEHPLFVRMTATLAAIEVVATTVGAGFVNHRYPIT